MYKTATLLILALVAAGSASLASANAMRGGGFLASQGHKQVAVLRAAMLDELMAALGDGNRVTAQRLEKIEEALRPMFLSLPKNAHGNLEHATVRYVLHRLFVLRHGMYVKGLEPGGDGWNGTASPTEVLDDKVPAYIQSLFEERLSGRGLGIHEIAILAATLEHLIHDEAEDRLKAAYQVNAFSFASQLQKEQVEQVIDTYMVMFLLGRNASSMTIDDIRAEQATILSVYPSWPESQKFTREVQQSVATSGVLDFNTTAKVVEEIGERYGRWQDSECHDLKAALMKLEDPGTGRVLLKNFYSNALGGAWQFTESVAYLKELGALDETDPSRKSVIIPNYINSPSNCLASSSVYSVCCLNECEALLGHFEQEIAEPDALPSRVLELVAKLPSSTVQVPRTISDELRGLLNEIADHHSGRVPLHGRLFAQWLHHAYPRECPYPHKAGTTKPMSADEWMEENGVEALSASEAEMQHHVTDPPQEHVEEAAKNAAGSSRFSMWSAEEELVFTTAAPARARSGLSWGRSSAFLALVSMCVGLWRNPSLIAAFSVGVKGQSSLPMVDKAHYC